MIRRFKALAATAASETLGESVSAVLFPVAALAVHLAAVFHYHQFGEAGRLTRECGFSGLLVFGVVVATQAAVRTVGHEITEGTAAMALSRAVTRPFFFCAKTVGVLVALALFAAMMLAATVLGITAAERGAELALENPGIRLWGPAVAAGVGAAIAAFLVAALAHRFAHGRFCLWTCLTAVIGQVAVTVWLVPEAFRAGGLVGHLLPSFVTLFVGVSVLTAAAAALSVWLPPAGVTAGVTVLVLSAFLWPVRAIVPDFAFFWMSDALSNGGMVGWVDVWRPLMAGVLLTGFWLTAGSLLLERREIS